MLRERVFKRIRAAVFLGAAGVHAALIGGLFLQPQTAREAGSGARTKAIRLLDLREESAPAAPPPERKPAPPPAGSAATPRHTEEPFAESVAEAGDEAREAGAESGAATPSEGGAEDAGLGAAYIGRNFDYIRRRIKDRLVYPPPARKAGIQGVAEIAFTLRRDGTVGGVFVRASSGHEILDNAALAAVYAAAPFRPPPPVQTGMAIPVAFKLR